MRLSFISKILHNTNVNYAKWRLARKAESGALHGCKSEQIAAQSAAYEKIFFVIIFLPNFKRNSPICFQSSPKNKKINPKKSRKKCLKRVFAALKKTQAAFSTWKIKIQIKFFPDTFVIYIVMIFAPFVNKNAVKRKNMRGKYVAHRLKLNRRSSRLA